MLAQELVTMLGFKVDQGSLKTVNSAVANLQTGLGSLGKVAAFGGGLLGGAAMTMGAKSAITYAASIEMLTTQFEVMTGSADRANLMMSDLRTMAATTPFDTKSLADGARLMLAFGTEAENVNGYLYALGDITQGDKNRFNQMNLAFSQMLAAGKLMGQDLLQMTTAGYNPLKTVAKNMKITYSDALDLMHTGQITPNDVIRAIQSDVGEGGKFYKGMEKGAKTLGGIWSNTSDNMYAASLALTEKMLPMLKSALREFNTWVQDVATGFTERLAPAFNEIVKGVRAFVIHMKIMFGDAVDGAGNSLKRLVDGARWVFFNLTRTFAGLYWMIYPIIWQIGQTFTAIMDIIAEKSGQAADNSGEALMGAAEAAHAFAQVIAWVISLGEYLFQVYYAVYNFLSESDIVAPILALSAGVVGFVLIAPKVVAAIAGIKAAYASVVGVVMAVRAVKAAAAAQDVAAATAEVARIASVEAARRAATMRHLGMSSAVVTSNITVAVSEEAIGTAATTATPAVKLLTTALSPLALAFASLAGVIMVAVYAMTKWQSLEGDVDTGKYSLDLAKKERELAKDNLSYWEKLQKNRGRYGSKEEQDRMNSQVEAAKRRLKMSELGVQSMQEAYDKNIGNSAMDKFGMPSLDSWMEKFKFDPLAYKPPDMKVNINNDIKLNAEVDKSGKTGLTPEGLAGLMDKAVRSVWNIKLSKTLVQSMR